MFTHIIAQEKIANHTLKPVFLITNELQVYSYKLQEELGDEFHAGYIKGRGG
jgi:hypothetical protein